MNTSVVLAMHGAPPRDFPKKEMMELFGLHLRLTVAGEDERAVKTSPDKIIVATPMMTRGGEHSEKDIPETLRRAQKMYPDIKIVYAWPYDVREVARFLSEHIKNFL